MSLETITGNLLMYKELEPGTFQHVDQLTTERRDNLDLRNKCFYVADGLLYTIKKRKYLLGITCGPQNLVLQHLDEAFLQLTQKSNYFPVFEEAKASFEHPDTVVVDINGLELVKDTEEYGHFVIDSKNVKKLNSQRLLIAKRIFGPDEDNLGQNMETFAKAEKCPRFFALMPGYIKDTLEARGKEYLARACWLGDFGSNSSFGAGGRGVDNYGGALRGVRRASVSEPVVPEAFRQESHERSDLRRDAKNQGSCSTAASASKFELEVVLDEFKITGTEELRKALQLYKIIKNLKI